MADESFIGRLGPFGLPVGLILAILAVVAAITQFIPKVGQDVVSVVGFLVLLAWAVWVLYSKSSKAREARSWFDGWLPRKIWRPLIVVIAFPALIPYVFTLIDILTRDDFSGCFSTPGGYASWPVAFNSKPHGASVRVALLIYADKDPWLEDAEHVERLPDKTPTCLVLPQNRYRAVFELKNQRRPSTFTVTGPGLIVEVRF